MSVMMMATMRLIMMMVPRRITPISNSIVNIWDSLDLALSEEDQRSSNSKETTTECYMK